MRRREMTNKVLLLGTAWQPDYWESDKEAPYPKTQYTDIPEWDEMSKSCPLPGVGRYIKQKDKDFFPNKFIYLKIMGMRFDPVTKQPYFDFKTVTKSNTESRILEGRLPGVYKKLFSAIEFEKLIGILRDLGEEPPDEWKGLAEAKEETIHWGDYVGKYFGEMEDKILSNNEFEDRRKEGERGVSP
jgi:hypothetical protein